MKIACLLGTAVVEPKVEQRVERTLRRLIKDEEGAAILLRPGSAWMEACEWAARRLEAACPEKAIERVGMFDAEEPRHYVPVTRYTRIWAPEGTGHARSDGVWFWMADQADYALLYFDSVLCCNKRVAAIYRYAKDKLGERCINLRSEMAGVAVREQISSLPKWQQCAVLGKGDKTPKNLVAERLKVSRTTVYAYEAAGIRTIIRSLRPSDTAGRCCAIFGFSQPALNSGVTTLLYQTLVYLIRCCAVKKLLAQQETMRGSNGLNPLLRGVCAAFRGQVELYCLTPLVVRTGEPRPLSAGSGDRTYIQMAKRPAAMRLEEKHAMIDRADIVVCYASAPYRNGLAYARKKHIPVIDLASYTDQI